MSRVGSTIARKYEVLRLLGAGGMGAVYEVRHVALEKRVALKLLHGGLARDAETVTRFLGEARAAASIGHPGILDVRDLGVTDAHEPYIEMELLVGKSLRELVDEADVLSPERVAELVADALDALSAAHDRGIVHRDIKPENLFLATDATGAERVKVLDFGIARARDGETPALTRTGAVLGTALYMSPEQLADPRRVDARSDIYSMGATLFELLTGSPALEARTFTEAVAKLSMGDVRRSPAEARPGVPAWLDVITACALCPDPAGRFASAREMRDALRAGVGGTTRAPGDRVVPTTVAAAPPRVAPVVAQGRGRSLAPIVIGLAALTAAAATAWIAYARLERSDAPVALASRPSVRSRSQAPAPRDAQTTADDDASSARATPNDAPPPGEVVFVPGATITMGSSDDEVRDAFTECRAQLGARCRAELYAREQPLSVRVVRGLWVDRHEVTAGEMAAWIASRPDARRAGSIVSSSTGEVWADLEHAAVATPSAPALGVSWHGARRYCEARGARLPTEAEWERIARGVDRRRYPWGSDEPSCGRVCFGRSPHGPCARAALAACNVGTSMGDRTPDGILDLAGNASEWTADVFTDRIGDEAANETRRPAERVVRGGSYAAWPEGIRAAGRARLSPDETRANVGFRCVLDASW